MRYPDSLRVELHAHDRVGRVLHVVANRDGLDLARETVIELPIDLDFSVVGVSWGWHDTPVLWDVTFGSPANAGDAVRLYPFRHSQRDG